MTEPEGPEPARQRGGRDRDDGDDPAWPPHPPGWRHDAPDPPHAFPVPWGVGTGLVLVVWSIVAQLLVQSAIRPEGVIGPLLVIGLTQVLTLAGLLWILRRRGALSWRLLGPVRPAWRHVGIGVGIGVSGIVVVVVLLQLASELFGPIEEAPQPLFEDAVVEGGLPVALLLLTAVLLAPPVEELIYRGALFQPLRQRLGVFPGMGISAFVFGVAHVLPAVATMALVILGFWLAAAFHKTGSLVVPVVGHATYNALFIALASLRPTS